VSIEPDTKDWTWVVDRACPDCRFDPAVIDREKLPDLIHENARGWYALLLDADAAVRPAPHVWSRLEYACHVRDVHQIFAERVQLMLDQVDPEFDNWDQDETATDEDYGLQDPAQVAIEMVERAAEAAAVYASVSEDGWQRAGRRKSGTAADRNDPGRGSEFTVASIGLYHLHDVVHHLWDVTITPARAPQDG
jgi:hypothetical protein